MLSIVRRMHRYGFSLIRSAIIQAVKVIGSRVGVVAHYSKVHICFLENVANQQPKKLPLATQCLQHEC